MSVDLLALARDAVQKLDRRAQTPPTQPKTRIAVQDDGVVLSNNHRILNFQGDGVLVVDEPGLRRTNIVIPGASIDTADYSVTYTIAMKILDLWNGSSNNAPPTNWFLPGFNDSAWPVPSAMTGVDAIYGNSPDISTGGGLLKYALQRQTFTLPAGTITAATVNYNFDSINQGGTIWINGTPVTGTGLHDAVGIAVPITLLTAGGPVTIAAEVGNDSGANVNIGARVKLLVSYTGAGLDDRYQLLSEKDQANGYAGLDANVRVPTARLGSGSATSGTFLRGDQSWAAVSTNSISIKEIDGTPTVTAITLELPNGTVTDQGGGVARYTPVAPGSMPYINLQDQKTSGTAAGTFTSGAWRTRDLNTEQADTGSDCTLASNQFALTAGTYRIHASAPAGGCDSHQARLQNITDTTTTLSGTSAYASPNNAATGLTRSDITGRFTIAGTKTFEIQHQCQTTRATNGLGTPSSFTVAYELFTFVELWKES